MAKTASLSYLCTTTQERVTMQHRQVKMIVGDLGVPPPRNLPRCNNDKQELLSTEGTSMEETGRRSAVGTESRQDPQNRQTRIMTATGRTLINSKICCPRNMPAAPTSSDSVS